MSIVGLDKAVYLPNIPFENPGESIERLPISEGNYAVASIAAYKHKPNIEGVQWFLDNVWPTVYQEMPDASFLIYGSNLDHDISKKWYSYQGVKVVGFVEKIEDAYATCCLTICPVLRGAGTNIKVVESGAHGRNCIMTSFAARGYSTSSSMAKHLWVAQDAAEMADKILYLLKNRDENIRTASEFADVVSENYSVNSFESTVRQLLKA